MPPLQTRRRANPAIPPNDRKKNGQGPLIAGVVVGGGALGFILWFLLRRKKGGAPPPPPPPPPPGVASLVITDPAAPFSVEQGTRVDFAAIAVSSSGADISASIGWSFVSPPLLAGTPWSAGATTFVIPNFQGTLIMRAAVTDPGTGAILTADSPPVTVFAVSPPPPPPPPPGVASLVITDPAAPFDVEQGTRVDFAATALSSSGADISASIAWSFVSPPLLAGTPWSVGATTFVIPNFQGTLIMRAAVTDPATGAILTADSPPVTVTPGLPSLSALGLPTINGVEGETSVAASEGTPITVNWRAQNTGNGTGQARLRTVSTPFSFGLAVTGALVDVFANSSTLISLELSAFPVLSNQTYNMTLTMEDALGNVLDFWQFFVVISGVAVLLASTAPGQPQIS